MRLRHDPGEDDSARRRGGLARLIGLFQSVPFASVVVAVIALACVLGTLLPQNDDVAKYLQAHPDAKGLMDLLGFMGLTRVYTAWWFVLLLCLLATSLAICSFRRFSAARRQTGRARGRALGSMLTHVSMLLILGGGVVRGVWGERGHLEFREGETRDYFIAGGEHSHLPFAVRLVDFEIENYGDTAKAKILDQRLLVSWAKEGLQQFMPVHDGAETILSPKGAAPGSTNSFRIRILRQVADFVIDTATREVRSRSDEPRNPAVQVEVARHSSTNTSWIFARHPGFDMHAGEGGLDEIEMRYETKTAVSQPRVKDFRSTLQIVEGDTVVKEKTIEVNLPLSHGGYTFYQSGYNARDPKWTSLQVVRDPGVPLVYAGFALMIAGLAAVFYLYPASRPTARPAAVKGERR